MYTKGILNRYADSLDISQGEVLKQEVANVECIKGYDICGSVDAVNAFVRAGIESLFLDFEMHFKEFIDQSDLDELEKYKNEKQAESDALGFNVKFSSKVEGKFDEITIGNASEIAIQLIQNLQMNSAIVNEIDRRLRNGEAVTCNDFEARDSESRLEGTLKHLTGDTDLGIRYAISGFVGISPEKDEFGLFGSGFSIQLQEIDFDDPNSFEKDGVSFEMQIEPKVLLDILNVVLGRVDEPQVSDIIHDKEAVANLLSMIEE